MNIEALPAAANLITQFAAQLEAQANMTRRVEPAAARELLAEATEAKKIAQEIHKFGNYFQQLSKLIDAQQKGEDVLILTGTPAGITMACEILKNHASR